MILFLLLQYKLVWCDSVNFGDYDRAFAIKFRGSEILVAGYGVINLAYRGVILHYDKFGNLLRIDTIYTGAATYIYDMDVKQDKIILAGQRGIGSSSDLLIVRMDTLGDTLWTKCVDKFGDAERGNGIFYANNDTFVVTGYAKLNANNYFYTLMLMDTAIIWQNSDYLGQGEDVIYTNAGVFACGAGELSSSEAFLLLKYNFTGNIVNIDTIDFAGDEGAYSLIKENQIYVTGYVVPSANADCYIVKYNFNCDTIWTGKFAKGGGDYGYSVFCKNGYVYVAGMTQTATRGNDILILQYDTLGNLIYCDSIDLGTDEEAHGIVVDDSLNVYICGYKGGVNTDIFVLKLMPVPDIELSDTFHDFGNVKVGDTVRWQYLIIKNTGFKCLTIDSIKVDFPYFVDISQIAISPFDSALLTVSFSPKDSGVVEKLLKIYSNDPDEPISTVRLKGGGLKPGISLSDTILDFGQVLKGDTSTKILVIKNAGNDTLFVDSMKIEGNYFSAKLQSFYLLPAQTYNETLYFIPQDTGEFTGTFYIYSNDPDKHVSYVDLMGKGIKPILIISQRNIDFGNVDLKDTVMSQICLKNAGNANLIIDSVKNELECFWFSQISGCTLTPEDSTLLNIYFSPKDSGEFSDTLKIYSTDIDSPLKFVSIFGMSILPYILLSQNFYDFGQIFIGDSAEFSFYIKNIGSATLIIDSIAGEENSFKVLLQDSTIRREDSALCVIKFIPQRMGEISESICFYSNDQKRVKVYFYATGTGLWADIEVGDTTLDFGVIAINDTFEKEIMVYNQGNYRIKIDSVILRDSVFWLTSFPESIAGFDTIYLKVYFAPKDSIEYTGKLYIYSDDEDEGILSVSLKGKGGLPEIKVYPDFLDFGEVNLKDTADTHIVIKNEGDALLEITKMTFTDTSFWTLSSFPLYISGSDSILLGIYYNPKDTSSVLCTLYIYSNDKENAVLTPILKGKGTILKIEEISPVYNFVEIKPNPAKNKITIYFEKEVKVDIGIFDICGRSVKNYKGEFKRLDIDLKEFKPGIYFVRCEIEGKRFGFKFLKMGAE